MLVICLMLVNWNLVLMLLIPYNKRMPQKIQPSAATVTYQLTKLGEKLEK